MDLKTKDYVQSSLNTMFSRFLPKIRNITKKTNYKVIDERILHIFVLIVSMEFFNSLKIDTETFNLSQSTKSINYKNILLKINKKLLK